jgi:hypothetical protein
MQRILYSIFLLFSYFITYSQIATFNAVGNLTGTASALSPATVNPVLKVSSLTRSNGILGASATDRLASTDFTTTTSLSETDYYSLHIAIPAGQRLTITNLVMVSDRNANGIRNAVLRSSLDNFSTNLNAAAIAFSATTSQTHTINTPTLTNITYSFVEFRLYGFGAITCAGNWRIQSLTVNGSINTLADGIAPTLTHRIVVNPTQMLLRFSETLNKSQAQNVANYTINNGIGNPQNATLQSPDSTTVVLNFQNSLVLTQNYTLTINNLADISNNISPTITQNFTNTDTKLPALVRCVPITNDALDVYFSEEVNAVSSQNIANYSICNESNLVGASRDNTNKSLVHLLFMSPMTENANRILTVRNVADNQGNTVLHAATNFMIDTRRPVVDSLVTLSPTQIRLYFSEPLDRISAELRNNYLHSDFGIPTVATLDNQNFSIVNLTLSSPMIQGASYTLRVSRVEDVNKNIITTRTIPFIYDKIPPTISALSLVNLRTIELYFSENLEKASAELLANYELRQGMAIIPLNSVSLCDKNFNTVFLRPTLPLADNQAFTLTVRHVRDAQFNAIAANTSLNFSTIAPTFNKVHVIDSKNLRLFFSEPLSQASAENVANYTLSGNPVTQALRSVTDASVINLTFANDFGIAQNRTLTLNNLQDLTGNNIANNTNITFTQTNFISNVAIISPRLIDVRFIKVVPPTTVLDTANYLINNNIGKPIGITRNETDSTMVRLLLRNILQPNVNYTLNTVGFNIDCNEFLTASQFTFSEDRLPPTLVSILVNSARVLTLTFSKNLDATTATALNHYTVTGFGNPTNVVQNSANSAVVTLTFGADFQQNTTYTLQVERIKDRLGNLMTPQTMTFQRPTQPKLNELLITEIMADPDPVRQLPNEEYIEIYNNSNTNFQLIGIRLLDGTNNRALPNYELAAKDYVLVVSNGRKAAFPAAMQNKIIEVSPAISLTNSGRELQLLDQDNNLIFKVIYSDLWYRDAVKRNGGWSLEMVNPTSACLDKAPNWIAAIDSVGGTPTKENSVWNKELDKIAPTLSTATVTSLQQIRVTFSEDLDSLTLLQVNNYSLNNNVTISNLQYLSPNSILLNTNSNLDSAKLYVLTAKNIRDCAGNATTETTLEFGIGTRAKVNDLLITEIMADETPRVGLPLAEWIEIYNTTDRIISLGSVRLSDDGATVRLPQRIIKPKQYLVLSGTTKADSLQALGVTSFPSLANAGETLTLSDTSGYVIYAITYSDTWYGDAIKRNGGWTLEMIDTNFPCGEAQNWTASTNPRGGTPNLINSVSKPNADTQAPKVANFRLLDDKNLEITFDEKMDRNSLQAIQNYVITPSIAIQTVTINSDRQIIITLQNAVSQTITYKFTLTNVADCSGNMLTTSIDFGLGRSPKKGEIVINEIMADESPAVKLPLTEWVELHNTTNDLISLNGVQFTDGGAVARIGSVVMQPRSYLVLCSSTRIDSLAKVTNRANIVGVTNFPSLTNAGETLTLRNAQNEILHEVTYSDTWYKDDVKKQGGWTLEMLDANNLCAEIENWTASVNARGGTPAQENSVKANNADVTLPVLSGVKWLNNTELELNFSEKMDSITISNKANFAIIPQIEIKEIQFIDFKTIKLLLNNTLNTNVLYELQAKNIKDCSQNETALSSLIFGKGTFPTSYELLITEIMADPSPVVQLPDREYIEIYNNSQKLLDLGTVRLQDEGASIALPNTVLKPQEYAVLCSTTTVDLLKKILPSNARIIGVTSFPTINNGGETLTLLQDNKIIHQVPFKDTWYRDEVKKVGGWSLEMIDTNSPCLEENNWRASVDVSGGTPARENSVKAINTDKNAPIAETLNLLNNNTLQIIFSEKLDSLTALQIQNYAITPNIEIANSTMQDSRTVVLTLKTALQISSIYQLNIQRIKDCSGNTMTQAQNFTFGVGVSPNLYETLITELMPDPSPVVNLPESEYIELYNPTNKVINLQGSTLSNNTTTVRLGNIVILPKSYVLLCPTTSVEAFKRVQPNGNIVGLSPWVSLANDGATITLRNNKNQLVFDVTYSSSWYRDVEKAEGGWSLEMIDVNFPCVQNPNWTASESRNGGTPATTNSVAKPNPDTQNPVLQKVNVVDNRTLQLIFSEKLDSLSTSILTNYLINNNITIARSQFNYANNNIVIVQLQNTLQPKIVYNLSVFGVADCSNNSIATRQNRNFVLPESAILGDIILNEVLFNPPVGGVDFVEIYNKSDKFIDLKGWGLSRIVNGQLENPRMVSTETLIIPPKSYLVFTPNLTQLKNQYPQGVDSVWVQTAIPTYSDESGSVILLLPNNTIADQFDYDEKFHFKLLDNKEGVSLERLDFDVATNDRNNWFSAAAPQFGTPGYRNSQTKNNFTRQAKCWWVENEVITPDGDSFQDFAFIYYGCNQTSFLANAEVYDSEGRKIKTLFQSQLLAAEGFFRWEGDMDNGQKARMGYYIIHIYTFNLQGAREDWQLKCVVGSK